MRKNHSLHNGLAILSIVSFIAAIFMFSLCEHENILSPTQESIDQKSDTNPGKNGSNLLSTAGFGNGVNLQPSYYNNGNVTFGWTLMRQNTKIKTLRIEIEPDKVEQAKTWISQARSNGYNIICTYHYSRAIGSDKETDLLDASIWWTKNYSKLKAYGSFTINLMNEWGSHNITAKQYATSYNKAIRNVRSVYGGKIIIDCPGYGQETTIAVNAVKGYNTNSVKITDTNIILSIHVYKSAWNQVKNRWLNTSDLIDLASTGRPCLVGEFGSGGSGNCDWSGIVNTAKLMGWTVIGWAWNGDGGTMNMVKPSWNAYPTAPSYSKSTYWSTIYDKL